MAPVQDSSAGCLLSQLLPGLLKCLDDRECALSMMNLPMRAHQLLKLLPAAQVLQMAFARECKSSVDAGLEAGQQLSAALIEAVLDADPAAQFPPLLVGHL